MKTLLLRSKGFKMMKRFVMLTLVACVTLLVVNGTSHAAIEYARTYGFYNVTNNNATNSVAGEAQLTVSVGYDTDNANVAYFLFENSGPAASSITDVYFEDGALLEIASLAYSSGVAYSVNATPGNLPGGNGVDFVATAGFTADSDAPAQPNGVNPGEWLRVKFTLQNSQDFDDVLASLDYVVANGKDTSTDPALHRSLRIGVHVQGFANGGSESFVNNPEGNGDIEAVVPEPASLSIWGLCAFGAFVVSRRRRRKV